MYVPRVAAGEPTPWLGVVERIMLGAFLLWVVVLATILWRRHPHSPARLRRVGEPRTTTGGQPSEPAES